MIILGILGLSDSDNIQYTDLKGQRCGEIESP